MEEDSDFPPGRRLRSHPAGVFGGVRPPFARIAAKLPKIVCMASLHGFGKRKGAL